MEINSICVCGAGTMGSGIAQVAAQSGLYSILYDLDASMLEKGKSLIKNSLNTLVTKNKITLRESDDTLSRILFTTDIHQCLADLVIEAIVEKMEAKVSLFNQLAEINHSETIFASNTSSLSISGIAGRVKNPGRVIGMHFFNPAQVMRLVEVISTSYTESSVRHTVIELCRQMGKTPVVCKDSPGFIVNRVARPFYIESLRLAEENLSDTSTIDRLMEASGFKMGPFKLMDLIGNDINYAVSCSVYQQLGQPERLKPSFLQEEKVKQNKLGKKSGEGYYKY